MSEAAERPHGASHHFGMFEPRKSVERLNSQRSTMSMMKIDPYKHEAKYRQWKQRGAPIPRILESDANLIRRFLFDLELGLNVSRASKRGPRSFHRLNTLRVRLASLSRNYEKSLGYEGFAGLNEGRVHALFAEMRSGGIRRVDGKMFLAVGDHVKDFRTFWRWYIEVQRKAGVTVPDVAMYLDSRDEKPKWVYLAEDQVRLLCNEAKFEYRVLMMFLLDSGVRSPSELINLRLCDFDEDFKRVQIRDEVSKTFGRRINLLLSSELIRDHVLRNKLSGQAPVFSICPTAVNRYLQRLAARVLGNGVSLAGERYAKLTMYDFRHVSACFWLPRYKSEAAMKYRFGWKQTERIHYYTELLGMSDSISEADLRLDGRESVRAEATPGSAATISMLQAQLEALRMQFEMLQAGASNHQVALPIPRPA